MNEQLSVFTKKQKPPLAERMRPKLLDDFMGQEHIVGPNTLFRRAIEQDTFSSCIFWGPPGSGKTTLANIIAQKTSREFVAFNAAFNGIKEVKEIVEKARVRIAQGGKSTVLFIDEIHRFNKAQQDAFLHPIEHGIILLIGATTENPSFEINSALLSRCSVYTLKALTEEHISSIIKKVLAHDLYKTTTSIDDIALAFLANYANGDARVALNVLDIATSISHETVGMSTLTKETIQQAISSRHIAYDKNGDEHYNLISALHKSLRGSDPQAGLYWLARMIEGGADPLYIARRLVRFASEDVGLSDPQALVQAIAAKDACHFLGFPECNTALAQCVVYLATAPKSNSIYTAINAATRDVQERPNEGVPLHIRNAPTKLMKNLGYSKNYQYDQDSPDHFSGQDFLPEALQGSVYYKPGEFGFEREISKRIAYWKQLKQAKKNSI